MSNCKVTAICNQKGGVTKTTTTANLGIGLAMQNKKVLLVDIDPQADLTASLGWPNSDALPLTLADIMEKTLHDEDFEHYGAILRHDEGVDLIPSSIELSGMEMSLVNAMSREFTLRNYLELIKHNYDYVLSYIEHPKQHSKGKYKHYGEWLGDEKPLSWKEKLKAQIDACLAEKPQNMDAFLQAMAAADFEVKQGRGGVISFRAEGQERFTRLRSSTLGEGYGQEDIQAIIEGRAILSQGRSKPVHKVNLIIDIQSRMRAGKGPAYERWAKVFNLKQMAATLQFLQENDLLEYEQLAEKTAQVADRFHSLSDSIKSTEAAMKVNAELKAAVVDYAKTRHVFDGYKAAKYSKKYLAEYEADIALYRAAQDTFRRLLSGAKLPKMDALKIEYQTLTAKKKAAYGEYREVRKDMQELITAKANIDHLLGLTDAQKNKEMER